MKKLLLTILLLSLTACSSLPLGAGKIPANETLETTKDKILDAIEKSEKNCDPVTLACAEKTVTSYIYVTDKQVESGQIVIGDKTVNEDITLRTPDRKYFKVSDSENVVHVYTGTPFHKDTKTGVWYETDIGTTTPESYAKQIALTPVERLFRFFSKPAYADSTSTVSQPGDGTMRCLAGSTWANARSGGTGCSFDYGGASYFHGEKVGGAFYLGRAFMTFYTVIDGTVTAATLNVVVGSATFDNTETTNPADITVASSSLDVSEAPTANAANWVKAGDTKLSDTVIDILTWKAGGASYQTFAFNATGVAYINEAGETHVAMKPNNDYSDSTGPTLRSYSANPKFYEAGTGSWPYLSITYTPAAAPSSPADSLSPDNSTTIFD